MSAEPSLQQFTESATRRLAAALRSSASKMSEQVGGGLVLVFAAAPGDRSLENASRLRAASGFLAAETAREAAQSLLANVREAISSRLERTLTPLPTLGERAAGGLVVVPIELDGNTLGALVIGAPNPIEAPIFELIRCEAQHLALRIDHTHIGAELGEARAELQQQKQNPIPEESEEVLKLSEALFAQDIELLRTNEKLGEIEKLKNDFIEKMSRELRTPLNSIIEAIISVLTSENEALGEASKASLRCALDDGTEFLRTLQNILDLWRIKQRELPVEVQDVNIREVIDEAIFSVQDRISDKPLSIEPRIEEPFPKIRTDLAKINQILFLLLENAVKFTERGKVTITAKLINGNLHCEVRDTGIGVCADDQPYIFDEFFQVDDSPSRSGGAGLGLALVRDLTVLLEGEVAVTSDVGRGTSVSLQIPVSDSPAAS
ncbi:MAG: HAMP domain-containing sensor histidine kinase [Myxococcota bacterium]